MNHFCHDRCPIQHTPRAARSPFFCIALIALISSMAFPLAAETPDIYMFGHFREVLGDHHAEFLMVLSIPLLVAFTTFILALTFIRRLNLKDLKNESIFTQQIVDGAQEGIIVYNLDLTYRSWNPFMEKLTGLPASKVLGRHCAEVFPFLKTSGLLFQIQKALAGELVTNPDIFFTVPETNRKGWSSGSYCPLRDAGGKVIGVIGIIRDISEKKAAEEFNRALARERELNALKTTFTSTISHEFRTPLSVMRNVAYLLRSPEIGNKEQTRLKIVKLLDDAISRLNLLVEQSLTISRDDLGKILCQPVPTVPATWVAELVDEFQQLSPTHRIKVISGGDVDQRFLLDPKLLRYMLENLLSNAIKFSPTTPIEGSEQSATALNEPEVRFFIKLNDDQLEFTVEDDGIGIPTADQTVIFQPFKRGSNVEGIPGAGLGLVIAERAARHHGGVIRFTSETGRGTTFTVSLPAKPAPSEPVRV